MALTDLQKHVMRCLAANRSETSYIAGGVMLNRDWPRRSDDIDVFHDTDEEIVGAAQRDIAALREARFTVIVEVEIYGCVEARVSLNGDDETMIQWMSETKRRFFPLVRDEEWGARLHQADLAVNKVLAAASRTKARDFVDLVCIEERMCPLGPLLMAAAGKPPHFSPQKIVDEIRRRGLSVATEDYDSVKGIPKDWNASYLRGGLSTALDDAESYLTSAPSDIVGILAVDSDGTPVAIASLKDVAARGIELRRATEEPEVIPEPADAASDWASTGSRERQ